MITTNFEKLLPEFLDEIKLFAPAEDVAGDVRVIRDGENLFITVSLAYGGRTEKKAEVKRIPAGLPFLEEKRLVKRYAKLLVYEAAAALFQKEMPWGALTGIRPTKLAYQERKATGNFETLFSDLHVSKKKTELVSKILSAQDGIYGDHTDAADFFVGIPFCPTRCKYCSFISSDVRETAKWIPAYVSALVKEITAAKSLAKNLRSVYVGGGTPVALPQKELERVLKAIGKPNVEFTVEAGRPDAISDDNLRLLKDYGVTRICVNPQTFQDKTLVRIGRCHTAKDIFEKYELAKKYGFTVNMDFIAGLEGETLSDFQDSLKKAVALSPENITVHTLSIKRGSALHEETARLSPEGMEEMVDFAHGFLAQAGYEPYYLYRQKYMAGNLENTGYTKKGFACVYNVDVMEETAQNVASGANAVSKAVFSEGERIERYGAPKDIPTYVQKIDTIIQEKEDLYSKGKEIR